MNNVEQSFADAFLGKFGEQNHRWEAFSFINKQLAKLEQSIVIVETGCARQEENWHGDGQSTLVFDWIVSKYGGSVTSIDISPENCKTAKRLAPNTNVICADSITALRSFRDAEKIDLLFLDSYDATGRYDSPLHHMGELAAIYTRLKDGCMIAIDDCFDGGKHKYVAHFFQDIGINPIIEGYITIWRKT